MPVRLSTCISTAPTEWDFVKLCTGDFCEYLFTKSKFDNNLTKTSDASYRDSSKFVLWTAAQNTAQLENDAKGNHSGFSMATHNVFILLTETCSSMIIRVQREGTVAYP
jgi:hypothetical protein